MSKKRTCKDCFIFKYIVFRLKPYSELHFKNRNNLNPTLKNKISTGLRLEPNPQRKKLVSTPSDANRVSGLANVKSSYPTRFRTLCS